MKIRRTALVAAAAVALALVPSAAMAYGADDYSNDGTVSDTTPAAGQSFTVTVTGPAGASRHADHHEQPGRRSRTRAITIAGTKSLTKTTNAAGTAVFTVTLSQAGTFTLVATDTATGAVLSTQTVTVAGAAGGRGQPELDRFQRAADRPGRRCAGPRRRRWRRRGPSSSGRRRGLNRLSSSTESPAPVWCGALVRPGTVSVLRGL